MVTLDGIRPFMKKKLTEDKNIHAIEVRADTLEECLADASVQLETKITHHPNKHSPEVYLQACVG